MVSVIKQTHTLVIINIMQKEMNIHCSNVSSAVYQKHIFNGCNTVTVVTL